MHGDLNLGAMSHRWGAVGTCHRGVQRRPLLHGPHVHGHVPVRLNNLLPNRRKDDLAVGPDQVIVTSLYMRADNVHVNKRLPNEFFYTLDAELQLADRVQL